MGFGKQPQHIWGRRGCRLGRLGKSGSEHDGNRERASLSDRQASGSGSATGGWWGGGERCGMRISDFTEPRCEWRFGKVVKGMGERRLLFWTRGREAGVVGRGQVFKVLGC